MELDGINGGLWGHHNFCPLLFWGKDKDLFDMFQTPRTPGTVLFCLKADCQTKKNRPRCLIAEFERTIIIERCQSGRAEAKRKGKKFGRPKGITKDKIAACSSLYMSGQITK